MALCGSMKEEEGNERFFLRLLQPSDYHKGFLPLLSELTVVGNVSEAVFLERFRQIHEEALFRSQVVAVVEDRESGGAVVATGSLLLERKFIRGCGVVGHIEDVVVDKSVRGHHLGQRVVEFLTLRAKEAGCYKVILDCAEDNVGFYEKCGFHRKEIQMAKYL